MRKTFLYLLFTIAGLYLYSLGSKDILGTVQSNTQNTSSAESKSPVREQKAAERVQDLPAPQDTVGDGFVYVQGGTFLMGSNSGGEMEGPAHSVTVSSFYICDHEVTQAEYKNVTRKSIYSSKKGDNLPVEKVSWLDAIYYCNKLSMSRGLRPCYKFNGESDPAKWGGAYTDYFYSSTKPFDYRSITCDWTANGYRLLTEAEWEFAARGGKKSRGYAYSGSDNIDEVAWYGGNSGRASHEVKQKKPNELGIYDMSGNVCEWCWDWLAYYDDSSETNPKGFADGFYYLFISDYTQKVYKGGSYRSDSDRERVASREGSVKPYQTFDKMGFRVARNVPNANYDASSKKKKVKRTDEDFVFVQGGSFRMGNASGNDDERPVHNETLASFYMCDHEVTQAEYKEIMKVNPSPFKGDSKPACVNWYEAVLYCNLLSEALGLHPCYSLNGSTNVRTWEVLRALKQYGSETNWDAIECDFSANGYRLPTEAEWEYAARGGNKSKGYKYSGGNNLSEVACYNANTVVMDKASAGGPKTMHHEPCNVKSKKPNELGIYDMSGNVCEWCWDWYTLKYGTKPEYKLNRILRGGGYQFPGSQYTDDDAASNCTVSVRLGGWPNGKSFEASPGMGIRLVRKAAD